MFKSVESRTISQIIVEQIQEMIMNGQLKNGDKLPPERQLSQMLGASRPAVREALKALEAVGLIYQKQGQGNFIQCNIENMLFKPLPLYYKLSNGNLEDILATREILEAYTIREAAAKATEEDIKKLFDIYNKMIAESDVAKRTEYDWLFHFEIAKISGNKLILILLESISHLFNSFINKAICTAVNENSTERINKDHLAIIKAIENHQPEEAIKISTNGWHAANVK